MNTLNKQSGALLIEVLITIAITVIGLMGLIQVQARLQKSEMESYQRTQALILLGSMESAIETNRNSADDYVTSDLAPAYTGVGATCNATPATNQEDDTANWCNALQGASETIEVASVTSSVGAMLGGRGCVEEIVAGSQYMVTVAWQGLTPISAPPARVSCGAGLYNQPAAAGCVDDLCRRYVTTMVRVGTL